MTSRSAPAAPGVIAIDVHYFAAAAEAAGRTEERLEVPEGTTLAGVRELLAGRGLEMAKVIGVCSYLVNSLSAPADSLSELRDRDRVDVLPPFAGG
ncbi:MoaD/ThiS family protein [Actinomyces sp. MRS3W]|uniref:MoaD/ThiS family protein n=1 Tax=Actinomyces sp. MRS3W TaxID=2800796 RepID=UPI0028FD7D0E|nr:MoaD/ThiS family protein [Actinomyces sp. MRS3W]MDU0349113.1 MoaD/ThiS family protein [Actinomyces sp. MRS3W]